MIVPVILAGGTGTRLWPLSRGGFPKQFHRLLGEHTLFQSTVLRARQLRAVHEPAVICSDQHRFIVAEQLREIGIDDATVILEPEGRNTAAAATIASLFALDRHGDEATLFLMSADHAVGDIAAFSSAAEEAASVAASGRIVTFGITPTRPDTGFGYLKQGAALPQGGFAVDAFVEKPQREIAQRYFSEGGYFWNGGLFLYPAALFLQEIERHEPDMATHCRQALNQATRDLDFIRLEAGAFCAARADSIDYAIMEKTDKAALVPMDAGWDDVGAWSFMRELPADEHGNVTQGDVLLEDSQNNLVHADSRLVATLGVSDHVVVETSDAVMIAPVSRVQDVKKLVSRLQDTGRAEAELHARIARPWGSYETIADGQRFQVKRIVVKPGAQLSLQMHHHRAEHWIVVRGTARVTRETESFLLSENESTFIPLGTRHRLENPGHLPLELIEVQSGSYLGEDDIVRFDDVYGRAAGAAEANEADPPTAR